ncbi:coiled-coil-helix-coiled-coil-helix domain-containing protein 1 [Daktulosphaira vitifoliae]|uniref:coiled-coil-helix-coiled-coil-helix domain-containing protein 1 n=1 Tax=Daktulosphaira vitifoliae TaxID=58002 RepID=UPI0021AA29B6|nr:coiled-coil-helix-coiled-coil-helix domain-containing protein 1 [Daktulosphaira vitifoliae]
MRLNNILLFRDMRKYTKNPNNVIFEELLPLKLKNSVSGKGDRSKERACVHEMSIMFACFKKNEFDQSLCSEEINKFQTCSKIHQVEKYKRKQDLREGKISTGQHNLSPREVNHLLKKYPNP